MDLAGTAKQQACHGTLDVFVAKDAGRHVTQDALLYSGVLRPGKVLEIPLFLIPAPGPAHRVTSPALHRWPFR